MSAELPGPNEKAITAALKPFGWTCTDDFWTRYYSDPWVFNLVNAVVRLTDSLAAANGPHPGPTERDVDEAWFHGGQG